MFALHSPAAAQFAQPGVLVSSVASAAWSAAALVIVASIQFDAVVDGGNRRRRRRRVMARESRTECW